MFGAKLGVFLSGVGLTLGVTFYTDESCDGDGGSLVPQVNLCGAGNGGYECNECTGEGT